MVLLVRGICCANIDRINSNSLHFRLCCKINIRRFRRISIRQYLRRINTRRYPPTTHLSKDNKVRRDNKAGALTLCRWCVAGREKWLPNGMDSRSHQWCFAVHSNLFQRLPYHKDPSDGSDHALRASPGRCVTAAAVGRAIGPTEGA